MSEFSDDIEDYIDFTFGEIEWQFGEAAEETVRRYVEETLQEYFDNIRFAESKQEREFAIRELQDFRVTFDEVESLAEERELEDLYDYMGQSYKYDREKIDRYIELTSAFVPSGGGGGGGGSSRPYNPQIAKLEKEIRKYVRLLRQGAPNTKTLKLYQTRLNELRKELQKLLGD